MEGILDPVSQNVICTLTLYCVSFIYSFCYSVYMDYINLSVEKCGVFCFFNISGYTCYQTQELQPKKNIWSDCLPVVPSLQLECTNFIMCISPNDESGEG